MRALNFVLASFLSLSLAACATAGQTTLLGSGVGAVVGASIGALADAGPRGHGRTQNIFIGATFGSLLGGGAAFLLHDNKDRKDKPPLAPSIGKDTATPRHDYTPGPGQPVLVPPRVETRYIDDQVRGNLFVPGHLEYQIVEPSQWSK